MNVKEVYQTDQSGFFVGVVAADESPLEPGVFLIPAGCVETPPPELPEGMAARWVNDKWVLEAILVAPASPPEPEPQTPESESESEPQTPEQLQKAFVDAIQLHMDNTARTFRYDDIKSAVTYAEEPSVPKFQMEGRGFRAWRSLVWAYAYEQLALVQNGEREQPTIADFIMELPELVIPELIPETPEAEEPKTTDITDDAVAEIQSAADGVGNAK